MYRNNPKIQSDLFFGGGVTVVSRIARSKVNRLVGKCKVDL